MSLQAKKQKNIYINQIKTLRGAIETNRKSAEIMAQGLFMIKLGGFAGENRFKA